MTEPSAWLRDFGATVEDYIRDEAPQSLIEYSITEAERERLYHEARRLSPWRAGLREYRAAIAITAVQAAADANAGDEAYVQHFLQRIGYETERAAWDRDYGPAIESFFGEFFHEPRRKGAWRYVRTIFRHAGIVLIGMDAYAGMLDRLLSGGTQFTWREYLAQIRKVGSTLIRPFLETQAGFKFTRATADYLRRHRRGELSLDGLLALRGYRAGFWPELLDHLRGEIGLDRELQPTLPSVALDAERGYLVLRFDLKWQTRGVYQVNGARVTYSEQRIGGRLPARVKIRSERPREVVPWWGPGQSPVALFRASDGTLLGHTVPPGPQPWVLRGGSYFLVAEASLDPAVERLGGTPIGVLDVLPADDDERPYSIWHLTLKGATECPEIGLTTIGRQQLPTLRFVAPTQHRAYLAPSVYVGSLPTIQVDNWHPAMANEFALRIRLGAIEREIEIPTGGGPISVPVDPPTQGRLWLEVRGVSSVAESLAAIDFAVLPDGIGLSVVERVLSEEEEAHVHGQIPEQLSLVPITADVRLEATNSWRVPARTRVFDASIVGPGVEVPVSLRLPVVSLTNRSGESIAWLELLARGDRVECDIDGPAFARLSIGLRTAGDRVELGTVVLGERGTDKVRMRGHLDALDRSKAIVGRFDIGVGARAFSAHVWFASAEGLSRMLDPLGDIKSVRPALIAEVRELPEIGPTLSAVLDLFENPCAAISVFPLIQAVRGIDLPAMARERIAASVANMVHLAFAFDGTVHDVPDDLPASPDVCAIATWLKQPTAAVPSVVARLRVERWKRAAAKIREFFVDSDEAAALIREWRAAVSGGQPSVLSQRAGGKALTDAARRYSEAMQQTIPRLRNQALTGVIATLQQARGESPVRTLANGVATILEQLARRNAGREIDAQLIDGFEYIPALAPAVAELRELAGLPPPSAVADGLKLADISPWDGDPSKGM